MTTTSHSIQVTQSLIIYFTEPHSQVKTSVFFATEARGKQATHFRPLSFDASGAATYFS
jgi:hypothetical protein